MQKYSSTAVNLFYNSKYSGSITGADVVVKNENQENQEIVKIYLLVKNETINKIRFQALGSVTLYACMTSVCELVENKPLDQANALSEKDVVNYMKQISKFEFGEVIFAIISLQKAIQTYSRRKEQGKLQKKNNVKNKNILPSRNVTVFGQNVAMSQTIESLFSETSIETSQITAESYNDQTSMQQIEEMPVEQSRKVVGVRKTDAEKQQSTKVVKTKTTVAISEGQRTTKKSVKAKKQEGTNSELMIKSVSAKNKKTPIRVDVAPTKIDVRVVDEPKSVSDTITKITTTQTTTKTVNDKQVENNTQSASAIITKDGTTIVEDNNMINEIDTITEQLTNAISQLNFKFDETPEEEQLAPKAHKTKSK